MNRNPFESYTYCPKCNKRADIAPNLSNEGYDSRIFIQSPHLNPLGTRCPETTTRRDARKIAQRLPDEVVLDIWPHLRKPKENVVYEQTPK